jgi:hypothetical protein
MHKCKENAELPNRQVEQRFAHVLVVAAAKNAFFFKLILSKHHHYQLAQLEIESM